VLVVRSLIRAGLGVDAGTDGSGRRAWVEAPGGSTVAKLDGSLEAMAPWGPGGIGPREGGGGGSTPAMAGEARAGRQPWAGAFGDAGMGRPMAICRGWLMRETVEVDHGHVRYG